MIAGSAKLMAAIVGSLSTQAKPSLYQLRPDGHPIHRSLTAMSGYPVSLDHSNRIHSATIRLSFPLLVCHSTALLFVIPQRSGGIRFCTCL
jgi:hypothetical protein